MCTFVSKFERHQSPEPETGPRSALSFEAALRGVLGENGSAIVANEDVVLGVSPIGVAAAAIGNDVRSVLEQRAAHREAGASSEATARLGTNYNHSEQ